MTYLIHDHYARHVDCYNIVPFYGILAVHDRYQRNRLADMHYVVVHGVQLHNGRHRMWVVRCLIGKLLVYVCHLDSFHLLADDCVALLILDGHTRFLHLLRARFDTARFELVSVHGDNVGIHMRMVVQHLDKFKKKMCAISECF